MSRPTPPAYKTRNWPAYNEALKRLMRLVPIYQEPNTSRKHPAHKIYPYLLKGLAITRPNQVWCADITLSN